MKKSLLPRYASIVCAGFSLVLLAGCPSSGSTLTGTVVLPSSIKLGANDSVTVSLQPEEKGKTGATAPVSASDMSFKAADVAPGKYKIAVNITPYPDSTEKTKKAVEPINEKYSNEKTSLRYEVTSDRNQSIAIDLDKGTVTKK
jgi:hypothetical protein